MTEQELLSHVPAEKREEASAYLKNYPANIHIGIRIILFVGALLSASMGAIGSLVLLIGEGEDVFWLQGLFGTGLGYFFLSLAKEKKDLAFVFIDYLGLIISMVGRAMLLAFFFTEISSPLLSVLCVTAVVVAGYPVFTHTLDRFAFSAAALASWLIYLFEFSSAFQDSFGYMVPLLIMVAGFLFASRKKGVRPLAYALLGVAVVGVPTEFFAGDQWHGWVRVFSAGLVAYGISRLKVSFQEKLLLCLATAMLACCLNFLAFVGLTVCAGGYLLRERIVEWLGAAAFAWGLTLLYYNVSASLLYKSALLMLSGVGVLALYVFMRRKYAR